MKMLETERLILRKYKEDDFAAVHSYGSCAENLIYMQFGPNSDEDTEKFINRAIAEGKREPCKEYMYAVVLKENGRLIGGCEISIDRGHLGWILHRDYWKQGYGTELGRELLQFGFEELGIRRISATCDAENVGSFRVMEKIGMRREGLLFDARPENRLSHREHGDELVYDILKDEWHIRKEIEYYNALPCEFDDFIEVPELNDGVIQLVCVVKHPAIYEKKYVPWYEFAVCKGSEKIGQIDLRIGYKGGLTGGNLYYGGQIGYCIHKKHRGNGYAVQACKLLAEVAKAHKMDKLLITNGVENAASKRVCEKLGAKFVRVARVPEWHNLYEEGQRFMNIFEWSF